MLNGWPVSKSMSSLVWLMYPACRCHPHHCYRKHESAFVQRQELTPEMRAQAWCSFIVSSPVLAIGRAAAGQSVANMKVESLLLGLDVEETLPSNRLQRIRSKKLGFLSLN